MLSIIGASAGSRTLTQLETAAATEMEWPSLWDPAGSLLTSPHSPGRSLEGESAPIQPLLMVAPYVPSAYFHPLNASGNVEGCLRVYGCERSASENAKLEMAYF